MADDIWRYAEPDGKQRALSLDDLQRGLTRGLLPTNVPVWRPGFADWTPAADVPELRASVSAGARIIPAKGTQKPGRPIAQRGGAAAEGEEPMSPPSYRPAKKARPVAPSLELGKADTPPAPKMRDRASTLLIAGGAPGVGNPESDTAPINVPAPGGAQESPNIITRPPPIGDGAVQVVPPLPPSRGRIGVAARLEEEDENAETREMPAVQRATLRDQAWDGKEPDSAPALEVQSSMLLPDTASVPEIVSTSMLLADDTGSLPTVSIDSIEAVPDSSVPDSAEVVPDSDIASVPPPARKPTVPPPLHKRPSSPSYSSLTGGVSKPPRPSFPSREEVRGSQPDPAEVADRIGLHSKPPPPDINPLSSDFPPPPGVPAELKEKSKSKPASKAPSISSRAPSSSVQPAPQESKPVVSLWGAIAALTVVGIGGWYLGTQQGDTTESTPVASSTSAPVAPSSAVASASATPDAAATPTSNARVACQVSSTARPIVSDAQPIDLGVTLHGGKIAIGYAKGAREAVASELDAASLAVTETVTAKTPGAVSRVVAHYEGDTLTAHAEFPNMTKGVALQRRDDPVVLGIAKGKLVRVQDDGTVSELFTMPNADAEKLRVSTIPGSQKDASYTYRASGAVWLGTTQKNDSPQRFPSLGGGVGTPSLVSLDASHILAAWPDRAGDDEPWGLRVVAYAPGKGSVTPKAFADSRHPGSMLGPSLARIDDKHALLLWTHEVTKNDATSYEVRGQVLDASGAAIGESLVLSAADMSAGQAQATVDTNGRGVVAFLVSTGDSFDVAVTGIRCK